MKTDAGADEGRSHDPATGGVGAPPDTGLPLFVYGLLKPGELAHAHIIGPHARCEEARLAGAVLRIRDGLPLLDAEADPSKNVLGYLIWFDQPDSGYDRVGSFEPRNHYRWEVCEVAAGDIGTVRANVLAGRNPNKGSAKDPTDRWDGRLDPVLCFGFPVVTAMVQEQAEAPFPTAPGDSSEMWDRFFRLSSVYLLLWSIVERYTALRFGPGLDPLERVRGLDACKEFRAAVQAVGAKSPRPLVDSRDPRRTYRISSDGSGAAMYWYAVRSNLSHRGKSAFQDGQLIRQCTRDLHATMKLVLGPSA